MPTKRLIVVVGPTAVGKTDLCVQLAQWLQTEIVSADSRQFYQGMAIGTAQPTQEERKGIPHHMIGCFPVHTAYSAGKFEADAIQLLNQLFQQHDFVILTGGSGLYIRAVCKGLGATPDGDPLLRRSLHQRLKKEGLPTLVQELLQLDPQYGPAQNLCNPQRVIRALEACLHTGKPYTFFRQQKPSPRKFGVLPVGLLRERTELYTRINQRVDQMVAQGLWEEVEALLPHRQENALQTIGYKELFGYFDKQYTRPEAIALLKRNTRRYAKRQLTWFRREAEVAWFHPEEIQAVKEYIKRHCPVPH